MHTMLQLVIDMVTCLCTASPAKQRDYTNCSPQWGDGVIYQGAVEKPSKLLQVVTFDLPVSTANAIIHCITAVNSKPSSTAAAVSVTSGGTGYNFVTLHFQSDRNHGIHYNVTISGR
ncbi:hypothetical protein PR048_007332 [Dryococelus australis]|uniref:Salivary secreted peptide n=1 Tax=Dryococelus australis TaxID=614101 RepID=A0ABQ9IFH9_9NEOP|nr:hypothetical protein PR048_007332 [Dryococelus australis]